MGLLDSLGVTWGVEQAAQNNIPAPIPQAPTQTGWLSGLFAQSKQGTWELLEAPKEQGAPVFSSDSTVTPAPTPIAPERPASIGTDIERFGEDLERDAWDSAPEINASQWFWRLADIGTGGWFQRGTFDTPTVWSSLTGQTQATLADTGFQEQTKQELQQPQQPEGELKDQQSELFPGKSVAEQRFILDDIKARNPDLTREQFGTLVKWLSERSRQGQE